MAEQIRIGRAPANIMLVAADIAARQGKASPTPKQGQPATN
ncbi:hypothetical protein [Martelella mangrovi]|uniref:Uncharacterized protein n=1 Tax=Martelella mangrovi TaxID=1397477 RepID=A0ABV2ID07_9HYPH